MTEIASTKTSGGHRVDDEFTLNTAGNPTQLQTS